MAYYNIMSGSHKPEQHYLLSITSIVLPSTEQGSTEWNRTEGRLNRNKIVYDLKNKNLDSPRATYHILIPSVKHCTLPNTLHVNKKSQKVKGYFLKYQKLKRHFLKSQNNPLCTSL